jgi:hypothetical protein
MRGLALHFWKVRSLLTHRNSRIYLSSLLITSTLYTRYQPQILQSEE